jgi:hypothetical protein
MLASIRSGKPHEPVNPKKLPRLKHNRAEESGQKYVAGLKIYLSALRNRQLPDANINFLALTKDPNVCSEELAALSEAAR